MKKVRVAVLGYGHLGKWHCQKVEANKEFADFVAIVEKFPAGQEAARANHPNVKVVSDISEIINDIDAAIVVTPTSTHFELVTYLLKNDKNVFCEKPLLLYFKLQKRKRLFFKLDIARDFMKLGTSFVIVFIN